MNKMFKKILAVAAVAATAACMSVSAFATEETTTPAVPAASHTDGSVSVTDYAAVSGATQYTVMLFEDSFATDNDVTKIYYINQGSDPAALLTGMLVKATTTTAEDGTTTTTNALPDGDYTVRIGNDAETVVDVDLKVTTVEETKTYTITVNVADAYAEVYKDDVLGTKISDGVYAFAELAGDATYNVVVKAPGALNKTIAVAVADADVTVSTDDTALVYGATAADAEQIGLSDLLDIKANYKKSTGEEGYSINLDFDRDGTVGLSDLLEVKANYKTTIADAYGN